LYTRFEAAITGQKAMSALAGRPGNSSSPHTPPINQNGIESAKTSKKKVRDDLLRHVMFFDEPSSTRKCIA
jgi:hypothetical protein